MLFHVVKPDEMGSQLNGNPASPGNTGETFLYEQAWNVVLVAHGEFWPEHLQIESQPEGGRSFSLGDKKKSGISSV